MGLGHSPSIIVDGLIFHIDPNNSRCYSGSGNTIYNLVNPSIGGTFVGFTANPIDNTETRSLAYNGSTTYQQFAPIEPTRLTLSVWFKATGIPSLNDIYGGIFLASSPQYFISYGMGYNWISNTVLIFQSSSGEIISASAPANKIVNAVYAYDGVNAKLYIDGVLASTVAYTTDPSYPGSGNRNLALGRWGFSGYERYFNGNIYQASIYNRALSASEILQNYNATRKKYYPEENIVSDGLVLHIDPSNSNSYSGSGNTIYNLTGLGNTGTLTNGPTFSGLNAGSIVFDGSNDFITFPSNSIFNVGTGDFTVVVWHKTLKRSTSTILCIDDGNGTGIILYTYLGVLRNWVAGSSQNGTIDICKGNWNQVVLRRLSGVCTQYIDTIPDASFSASQSVVTLGRNLVFGAIGNEYYYNGNISQALFYNRALTQQEISQNYNATKKRFVNALPPIRNGLVLELDAANTASYSGTGNTWYDLSGNNLNGTLTNGPTYLGIGSTSSISFDGTNDHILIADNSLLNTFTGMTLEVIVKYTTTNDQIFAQKWNYAGSQGYTLELYSSGIVAACYANTSSNYLSVSVSNYPINNIYYMVLTLTGNTQTLYINGISVTSNASGSVPSISGTVMKIGDRTGTFGTSAYFGGNVYLTKFYNRGLSAYEVKQNFDYYRTRYNI
ncbi:hypothetical protein CCP3SC1AL1_1210004 [Gammaproteobacteria bacterium]